MLVLRAIRCGGTGVHGHQRWEDISSKLMLSIAFEPLRSRIRYVSARVAWMLKNFKATIVEWMATISEGPCARFHSPLFPQHLAILRGSPVARDLVYSAFDRAGSRVAEEVLKNLQSTLTAGCINPNLILRSKTEPDMDPKKLSASEANKVKAERAAEAKQRVKDEMNVRARPSGLPLQLRDKVFEPKEAEHAVPHVEVLLRSAFSVLAKVLANQAYSFADNAMSALCRREVDEAMSAIDFTPEQRRVLNARNTELQDRVSQVEQRLDVVNKCTGILRRVRS